jgi:hypothetical protein
MPTDHTEAPGREKGAGPIFDKAPDFATFLRFQARENYNNAAVLKGLQDDYDMLPRDDIKRRAALAEMLAAKGVIVTP